ncbi:hypothetical protein AXX17_AT3G35200 [Arabidopsis thaliana]|uniref:Uncharacterized protein n=1 Tax=Arabidopsis thaliana TaxID=3702 RepID=A0A178VKF0_ARATH|nr:hypothetical protein AXX17_AT3G35200 [Arabidopsis thaliana]
MISSSFSHCQRDLDPGSPLSSRSYILHARDFSFSIKLVSLDYAIGRSFIFGIELSLKKLLWNMLTNFGENKSRKEEIKEKVFGSN